MNVGVKTLNQTALSPAFLSWSISIKNQLILWILVLVVLFSAFSLIYVKDVNRQLMSDLQMSQATYQSLHTEWSRLLLEEGTLSSRTRLEKVAKNRKMIVPSAKSIVLVTHVT